MTVAQSNTRTQLEITQACDRLEALGRSIPNSDTAHPEHLGAFRRDAWKNCAAAGLLGLAIDPGFGGQGYELPVVARLMDRFGASCLDNGFGFSVVAHTAGFALPIQVFGNDEQKALLRQIVTGEIIGCQAITEARAGSDTFAMESTASKTSHGFCLNGSKVFVSNAPIANYAIVFAMTDPTRRALGGVTAFVVDLDLPGVTRGRPISMTGLNTSPLGELTFHDVELSDESVLGSVGGGLFVFIHALNLERVLFFALHCGAIERLLKRVIGHARSRTQFGSSIGGNQAISHRIADMHVDLECSRLLVSKAAVSLDSPSLGFSREAAVAKLFVSEAYVRATHTALQVHGALGLTSESGIERELRDSLGSTIYAGTSEMQRNTIARSLGLGLQSRDST